MTRPVDLPHADRLALLQCREMGWIHSRTAAASLRAKGLAEYRGITAGTEEAHTITDAGEKVADLVSDELDGDRVQLPTRLHPGVHFRTHVGEPHRTFHRAYCGPDLWRIHTVEPWPVPGDTNRHWRDLAPDAPILIAPPTPPPDDWSLTGQMELFA